MVIYVFYGMFFDEVFLQFNIKPNLLTNVVGDLTFLAIISFYYKDYLKEQYKKYFSEKSTPKILKRSVKWAFILLAISLGMGIIRVVLFGETTNNTGNSDLVNGLNLYYRLFKTLIFAIIAEELLFRKTIRDVIDNNVVFIVVASFIYAYMNVVFIGAYNIFIIFDFTVYFIFYSLLNYHYVKYNNIFAPMTIKFIYAILITLLVNI